MKLSELVSYRRLLDEMTPNQAIEGLRHQLEPVVDRVRTSEIRLEDNRPQLEQAYQNSLQSIEHFLQCLDRVKQDLDHKIASQEPLYFARSYDIYNESTQHDSPDHIMNRQLNLSGPAQEFLRSRMQFYSNWQHPGILIRPAREPWIEHLVACDPLYVLDTSYAMFEPTKNKFNSKYLHRVRWYIITDSEDQEMLPTIPKNQFGFCLAYNFFHYKPLQILRRYLEEIYQKLKPGGTLAFTFNDCDRGGGVILVENNSGCYTPARMIRSLIELIGYTITLEYQIDAASTWIEIKKPGELASLRGGQALATIRPKISVDNPTETQYTQTDLENIRQQAIDLNIDREYMIDQLDPAALEKLIKQRTSQK
jgi:hypothetical protein